MRVGGRLLTLPLQKSLPHFCFCDERIEGVPVRHLSGDERSGARYSLELSRL